MMEHSKQLFSSIIEDFKPLLLEMGTGRKAVSLGGSMGKGLNDEKSDYDFRLFADTVLAFETEERKDINKRFAEKAEIWKSKGVKIDTPWARAIGDIETKLDLWHNGIQTEPDNYIWTIWGYYLPTDILNQFVVYDPGNIIQNWKSKYAYSSSLKKNIIDKNIKILRYWKDDYHYKNKVDRKDYVFLSGLITKLVHSILQILFALNETYYPGDGNNMKFIDGFIIKPENIEAKITTILFPENGINDIEIQYAAICNLINEIDELVDSNYIH